ncbi:MAG: L-aspartate oxidase [Gammaproteobacteria bacterium]|nr:L-aspartate oxidase [Gammaproteobacteria bacterium]
MPNEQHPVLIIGGGLAGLSLALRLAERGVGVTILSKSELDEGSTRYAQGGIAAVLGDDDSYQSHIDDTLQAGGGLCNRRSVEFVVKQAPRAVEWLIERGVSFSRRGDSGDGGDEFHLTREGGHSHRRVLHAADATGEEVEVTLEQMVRGHDAIELLENHIAIDLITSKKHGANVNGNANNNANDNNAGDNTCLGVYALDLKRKRIVALPCRHLVLATGGASKIYLYTSNPDTSTGDGIAMAWRAGCRVANMEFVQFHPTCLYHPQAKSFLISEAVRGEGGVLVHADGRRFMPAYDSRAELAPRDIVARAIDLEMKINGCDNVYLDLSHKPAAFIRKHFPTISARCMALGLDMTSEALPVVPAAHYTCGGVVTDLDGRTDIRNLYAIGETGYTGLHGANRLASNSLLECLVFAEACAARIAAELQRDAPDARMPALLNWDESQVTDPDERIVVSHNWDELRRCMWDYVGIVRTDKRLARAARRIALLQEEIREFYSHFRVSNDLIELRNLVLVAELTVRSALRRKESRGLHITRDHPQPAAKAVETILIPGQDA